MEQHNIFFLPFLDIMINKDPETNKIQMDIFYKKTDTRRCIPFNSCHPKQSKNNIPFALARRIFIIAENSEVREKPLDELQKVLCSQKCPQNLIQEAIQKATSIPTENLRASKAKTLIQTVFKSLQQSYETK